MKFGDIITAVATLTIIHVLFDTVLFAALIPVNSKMSPDVAAIVSFLLSSLIVGYVFAAKIYEESRRGAISKIAVLFTVVVMFAVGSLFTNPYMGTAIKEGLESMYSTGGWTTTDWLAYSQLVMVIIVALNVVLALVLSFIGLYAGSMLRKRGKS